MAHIRLQRVRGLDRTPWGRIGTACIASPGLSHYMFNYSALYESDIVSMRHWLVRRASLGPETLAHIRLQRVRGLDRTPWGRIGSDRYFYSLPRTITLYVQLFGLV